LIVVVRATDIGDKNSEEKIANRIKKKPHSLIYHRQGNRLVKFIKDLKEASCGSIRDRFFSPQLSIWISTVDITTEGNICYEGSIHNEKKDTFHPPVYPLLVHHFLHRYTSL
jgi:hypothetical protein